MADWNTLSATIRAEQVGPRANAARFVSSGKRFAAALTTSSTALESTLHRALVNAIQRKHE
jgi:hypothetical protein